MSKAFKCDICGKFYKENNEFHRYHIIDAISETTLDLCDSCEHKFESIIENKNDTQK